MSALTQYFFSPVYAPRSAWSIVNWWESRRVGYNLCVGAAGLVSLASMALFSLLPPGSDRSGIPWFVIPVYAVMANICYTLGPAIDLFIRRRWGNTYAAVGPTLFRYGFVFSIGLTLLPIPLSALNWVVRLLIGVS